jgi:DHA2 family multidrug resistance protein
MSSVLCGFSTSLPELLMFRMMQGLGGGGMVPVAQSILADAFPPEKRSQGFALFGVAVVVAPVLGPTLGGWLSDNLSWHWCFLINGPIGAVTLGLITVILRESKAAAEEREQVRRQGAGFDLIGFVLVATFLGALELVLDRGLDEDWFGSSLIVTVTSICALAFLLMIPWEMSRRNPTIDLRMVATPQFGACFVVMLATGAILQSTSQYVPQLVQEDLNYTATLAGLALSPGGVVNFVMMFIGGVLLARIQPKYVIIGGALMVAASMYVLTDVSANTGFWYIANSRMLQGIGLPLLFLAITTASYDGIPHDKTDQASALINVARNTGGSIGVSLVSNVLSHREQFHQSRLVEHAIPSSTRYQDTLHQLTNYFASQGSSLSLAHQQAIDWLGRQVQTQASFLAYIDAFWVLMLISLAAVPLALTLRKVKLGGATPMAH